MRWLVFTILRIIDFTRAIPYTILFVLEMAWLYLTWPFELLGFRVRRALRWRQIKKDAKSLYYREER